MIMKLHEKLKILRKKESLTQEELGNKLFVTKQAVYKWEKGNNYPDIDNLKNLSHIFKVKLDDLLNEDLTLKQIKSKERVVFMNEKKSNNLEKYVNSLPFLGVIISILLFIWFFSIMGVDSNDKVAAILYCLTPIASLTFLVYFPFKLFIFNKK